VGFAEYEVFVGGKGCL